jgi:hypothetical protein
MAYKILRSIGFALFFLIFCHFSSAQDFNLMYQVKSGTGDWDTTLVMIQSTNQTQPVLSAVNFSLAFQSSCSINYFGSCGSMNSVVKQNYSWFANQWGSFAERCASKTIVPFTRGTQSFNGRFSTGNTAFTGTLTIPKSTQDPLLILKVITDGTCISRVYLEDERENSANQIADATLNLLSYNVMRLGQAFPVEWLDVTAEKEGASSRLNWVTGQEINNSHFVVEKSLERNFNELTEVAQIEGAGFADEPTSYEAWDHGTMAEQVFYRIRQVDLDGTFSYSDVVEVSFPELGDKIFVGPNPFRDQVSIQLRSAEPQTYQIRLFDMQGRKIAESTQVLGGPTMPFRWDLRDLAKGIYSVELFSLNENEEPITTKIAKY